MNLLDVKQYFIKNGKKIIKKQKKFADSSAPMHPAQQQQFDALSKMMINQESTVKFKFCGDTIGERITCLIQAVADGKLTPTQGQSLIDIIHKGAEVVDSAALLEKLTELQDAGKIKKIM